MSLIGIIAKTKDIKELKKKSREKNEFVELTNKSIKNLRNIKFKGIIYNKDIILTEEEYKFMRELINKAKYIIINSDIEIKSLEKINIERPMQIITFGFNPKSTITISSVEENYIIIGVQREIKKMDGKKIEKQEKKIELLPDGNMSIYSEIINFLIKEL